MPGKVAGILHVLAYLIFIKILWDRNHYSFHFTDEESNIMVVNLGRMTLEPLL